MIIEEQEDIVLKISQIANLISIKGRQYEQTIKQKSNSMNDYSFLNPSSKYFNQYLIKLQEFESLKHNKTKGFGDKKIIHIIENRQRLQEMDAGMMAEILKNKGLKDNILIPILDSQVFCTHTFTQDPTKLQKALNLFLQEVANDESRYEKEKKNLQSKTQITFKPEVISIKPNESHLRLDGTMINSNSQNQRMGLGKSEDVNRIEMSLKSKFCKKCKNMGHLDKDCPF